MDTEACRQQGRKIIDGWSTGDVDDRRQFLHRNDQRAAVDAELTDAPRDVRRPARLRSRGRVGVRPIAEPVRTLWPLTGSR